eukprot:scaffold145369_cov43-Cyclotella_meneghiniana.AAC.1
MLDALLLLELADPSIVSFGKSGRGGRAGTIPLRFPPVALILSIPPPCERFVAMCQLMARAVSELSLPSEEFMLSK